MEDLVRLCTRGREHGLNQLDHDVLIPLVQLIEPHRKSVAGKPLNSFWHISAQSFEEDFWIFINR